MEKQLVINADDFGLTPGVSRGIARAFDEGVLTSASLLTTGSGFETAVELARSRPGLGVGLHLNLTDGRPVLPPESVRSLVDEQGLFVGYRAFTLRLLSGRVSKDELRAELAAQAGRLTEAGLTPTHVDGHRHVHLLPVLFDLVADAALRLGVRYLRCPAALGDRARPAGIKAARALGLAGFGRLHYGRLVERGLATADCFLGALSKGTGDALADAVVRLPELPCGLTEWMVHPGEVDADLMLVDDYVFPRQEELEWLVSDAAREAVAAAGVRLVDYRGRPKLSAVTGGARSVA